MRFLAFPLRPRYIRCSTTYLSPSLSKKLLDHFGIIINNPFVTPEVIFLINNPNFHSDLYNGSCFFLHAPDPAGGDVFEQQPPNNHSVHVHVPIPCINSSFICIVCLLGLNRYCGITWEFLFVSDEKIIVFCFLPNRGWLQQFLFVPGICGKGTTYFEWIHDTYEFTVYDIWFASPLIEAGCSSFASSVRGICG